MTIDQYLRATAQTQAGFARLIGMPQKTFHNIATKGGSCRVEQAELIIEGSRRRPAPRSTRRNPRHITLGALAAGARRYLARAS